MARNIVVPRHPQISDSHCGPAVLQMLLQHCGVQVSQQQIVAAAAIKDQLEQYGSRIDQLATATKHLDKNFVLYFKKRATLYDLEALINQYHNPVGVEWQGLFEDDVVDNEDLDYIDTDYGHYGIITDLDSHQQLHILDPYNDFIQEDRVFSFNRFLPRWWDTNEITDEQGKVKLIIDQQLLFIISSPDKIPPISGLQSGERYLWTSLRKANG